MRKPVVGPAPAGWIQATMAPSRTTKCLADAAGGIRPRLGLVQPGEAGIAQPSGRLGHGVVRGGRGGDETGEIVEVGSGGFHVSRVGGRARASGGGCGGPVASAGRAYAAEVIVRHAAFRWPLFAACRISPSIGDAVRHPFTGHSPAGKHPVTAAS